MGGSTEFVKKLLSEYLDANPHITPRPSTTAALRKSWPGEGKRFKALYARTRRKLHGDQVRANEAKYRATSKAKTVAASYEKRDYVIARHKAWRQKNPEKQRAYHKAYRKRYYEKECERVKNFLREYRTTDKYKAYKENYLNSPEYRWHCVQNSAKARNLQVELTKEDVAAMCTVPCYYCGDDPKQLGVLFGIDRVENAHGYTKANSVTCCTFCNYAKCDYHVDDFIRGMCNIAATHISDSSWSYNYTFTDKSKALSGCDYYMYRYKASKRGIVFELSKSAFLKLVDKSCVYCRNPQDSGVDRVDNNQGYVVENCVPCCSMCNRFKKDWDVETLVNKATSIFSKFGNKA